ncbi:putative non-ribosomal peptide synthetase [Gordonia polyisoprenivorans NBRC 16320 = JCM 10675]|uniref:Non-ribosomal peptide synthetase n=1 Tax=Gordonia polyisoprenivorans TaxID=84595 RepID=A0A846WF41_9ACTN|nr:non-ribosomal peptide synthetase [Gordonia polyisoprenivorans]NKY00425.1 non-ribosomal peptide synthetase [Gordonia polyisoprenivorans]GAB24389.1 putative non-ribosomal peptide synthetase [Gordonia polyisoprenivorans NBRC 16320 = JCM 10675]
MTTVPTDDRYDFPLNDAQKTLLQRQSAVPSVPLNVANYVVLEGRLDAARFLDALRDEVRVGRAAQITLRTYAFGTSGVYDPTLHDFVEDIDLRNEEDPFGSALDMMREDVCKPVDPFVDRLARGILFELSSTRFVLFQRTHHIVTDGLGAVNYMIRGLARIGEILDGSPDVSVPTIPDLRAPARADAGYRASRRFKTDRDYWRAMLDGVGGGTPSPSVRVGPPSAINRRVSASIPAATMATLRCAAEERTTTLPALIATTLAAYFARTTDSDDVVIDLAVAARTVAALRNTPLPTLNFVPVRTGVGSATAVGDALRSTQSALMGALRHQRYRRDDIVADHGSPITGPVLNIMMFERKIQFGEVTATFHSLTTGPVDDLSLNIYPDTDGDPSVDGSLVVELEANPNRYDDADVVEHHRQIVALVGEVASALVNGGEVAVDDLPMVVEEPAAVSTPGRPRVLTEILDETIERFGDRIAVDGGACGEDALTFAELDERATEFAEELRGYGARPGETVAITLPRGVEQVVAWWAVARSGAAILLVDPSLMRVRVETILRVAGPVCVVSEEGVKFGGGLRGSRGSAPGGASHLDHRSKSADQRGDGVGDSAGSSGGLRRSRGSAPGGASHLDHRIEGVGDKPGVDDVAYVVFTSGTTGEPKGIAVPHRGLANLIRDAESLLDDGNGPGRLAAVASPAFDIAHFEMLACAGLGYTLVPIPSIDAGLGAALVENAVTHLYATPSLIARIPTHQLPWVVGTIGETLPPAVANQVSPQRILRNTYGPAEATLYATVATLDAPIPTDRPTPIGAAVDGMAAYLLDHRLRPQPTGMIGEIYLAGAQLALGYLGRTDLTAARFVACPWQPGTRMYRTGDLARIDPTTGLLEFHGRNDDQISVHGVRIEPAEIERTAADVDGVDAAVAIAVHNTQGTTIDVAITTDTDDPTALAATVRQHLFATLPSMMWPRRVVAVDELPLGTTGKLDRRAVANLLAQIPITPIAYEPPTDADETLVAATVSAVLDVDEPSMLASVIDLGGTSLSVMEIVGRLATATGRVLTIADITAATTLRDIAARLAAAPTHTAPALTPQTTRDHYRPTRPQQELWLAHRLNPADAAYHLPVHLEFAPAITTSVLTAALTDVATRHEALRTVFDAADDGTATARVLSAAHLADHLPVTTAPLDEPGIHAAATAPFDLSAGPAWRATIDDSGDAISVVLVAHHIAVDGASLPILVTDFLTAVDARRDGHAPSWPSPAAPFSASITPDPTDTTAAQNFWSTHLDGAPDRSALPEPARPGPVSYSHRHLDTTSRERLAQTAAAAGGTVTALMRVTLAAVLARVTGLDDVVLSLPTSGRATTADLGRVGMFVRTLPLRHTGTLDQRLGEALTRTDATLAEAVRHADAAPAGLADVLVTTAVTLPDVSDTTGTLLRTVRPLDTGFAQTALQFAITDTTDGIDIRMTVDEHRVDPAGAALLLDAFVEAVTQLADATADTVIGQQLPPVAAAEPTPRRTPTLDPIRALIPHTRSTPHAIAVTDTRGDLTYSQLAARARTLAITLLRTGVRDGDCVALQMGRSSDTIIAMVAVLMAGAAYVPIDPDHPQSRIDELLDAATPVAIIGDDLHVEARGPSTSADHRAPGEAYVIFTSGSTGTPKGVSVSRDNLATMLGATLDAVGAGPTDVWSWAHSYAFDFSVWEIFGALASGGRIAVLDRTTVRDPRLLLDALATHGVTILSQTPTAFARLTDPEIVGDDGDLPALRTVVFGGEALHPTALHDWAATHSGTRLINMYGITETTVHLTAADVDTTDARSIIGTPLDGVHLSVRDARGRRVPAGGRGELYVSGRQVSRGYLNAAAATATRFVADPEQTGARMYRTGDLVRILPDGRLAYLGRTDDQIQLRGHRIEPAEIAAVLRRLPGVTDARVLVEPGNRAGDERLVAAVTGPDSLDEAVLRTECAAQLPAYAVPSRIGVVASWPVTDTGKLDRASLLTAITATAAPTRPLTDAEQQVAAVIEEVIGVDVVDADANFFALGGNSLSAARLAAKLSGPQRWVTVGDVFAHPTVSALTTLMARPGEVAVGEPLAQLSAAQRALWILNRVEPSAAYHLAVRIRLTGSAGRGVLATALRDVADRHEALRTIYPEVDGEPVPRVLSAEEITPITDLDERPAVRTPFDLSIDCGWRAVISADGAELVLVAHHIVVDGWSVPVLVTDFLHALDARRDGVAPQWPEPQPLLAARRVPADADYWTTHLAGAPTTLALPEPPDPHPTGLTAGPAVVEHSTLDAATAAALAQRAADAGTTVYALLWVALAATLAEITGTDDTVIGIPVAGRDDPATHGLVGMLARTVPLRASGIRSSRVDDALAQAHTTFAAGMAHADTAPVTVPPVLLDHDVTPPIPPGIAEYEALPTGQARTALDVTVRDTGTGMTIALSVAEHHVDPAAGPVLLQRFVAVLRGLARAADARVEDLLPAAEPIESPAHTAEPADVLDLLRSVAARHPEATAVAHEHGSLTYAHLLARASAYAADLADSGVGAGDQVPLTLPPSVDAVVAMVGVLMADAVVVPIDPAAPQERVAAMLARCERATAPGDAYVMHTSGSTGTPKGVIATRAGLAAMLAASRDLIDPRPGDVWACTHAPTFDVSVWEIFGALTSGGTVAIVRRDDVIDVERFVDALDHRGVTILAHTPTSFVRLTDPTIGTHRLRTLRCLVLGGEAFDPTALQQWALLHPDVRLVTMYGPTETTVQVTGGDIDVGDHRPLIGRPLAGVGAEVLDVQDRPVPIGGRGELYLTGTQLARGYVDPTETAARFVAAPDGTRRYRTGDLVRRLSDGRLAYLGRTDDQVQIRGYRVEPAAVVAVLRSVPGVNDARVVVDSGAQPGDERLVGFVIGDADESTLMDACAAALPAHQVPARIGFVDRWPLTAHGKLDREALLRGLTAPDVSDPGELTDREQLIADAMAATLGDAPPITADTNFFAVGGNSLSAARLASRLTQSGLAISVTDVFAAPTVRDLAALDAVMTDVVPDLDGVRPQPDRLPLAPEQEDLWLRWRAEPDRTGYLMTMAIPVAEIWDGSIDDLRGALTSVALTYDALRTSFPIADDGTPYQERWTDADVRAHLGALAVTEVADVGEALAALAEPIDLTTSLPWRLSFVEHDATTWILVVVHHIVADGETLPILRSALTAPTLPAVDYRRYTQWRLDTLDARRAELTAYWTSVFAEPVATLQLPEIDLGAPAGGRPRHSAVVLATETTAQLDALAADARSTPFIVLHTVLAMILARQSGSDVVTIGTALSGRVDPRLADVPGLFARAVPLHSRIDLDIPFTDLLTRVTATDVGALAHADLPLSAIGRIADPDRDRAGRPLFDVVLGAVPDDVASRYSGATAPLFGIDVMSHRRDGRAHLDLTCGERVTDEPRLDALASLLGATLEQAVAQPERTGADLLGGPAVWRVEPPPPETLAELLDAQLATPSAIAVDDAAHRIPGCGAALRYGDVDRLADALAWRLREQGIGPGQVVACHLPRSVFGVVATVAIARTGAAFVAVDPADPAARRRDILDRARAAVVLTLVADEVPDVGAVPVIAVDNPYLYSRERRRFTRADRVRPLHIDDAAYLTFTSGTTGRPKGVVVTHRGLAGWARDTVRRLELTPLDRVMHTYAVGFDAHLMGIVPVLAAGACVVICPPEVIGGDDLADHIADTETTVLLTTPSVLSTISPAQVPEVRHVAVGGEALSARLAGTWMAHGHIVSNEYGPTETTVAVTSARCRLDGPITIGATMPGVDAVILDDALRPVPAYTIGELYIGGSALARGYLDDPAGTAAAFVAGPDGTRMYRTGDLVHRRADGDLVIHGRRDDQLKVRGIRIEPAEVEAALAGLADVSEAVVAARRTPAGERVLAAWVIPAPGSPVDGASLREQVRTVLPRSVVPASITLVDRLPLGPTGKIDRSRLPAPDLAADVAEIVAPRTDVERTVAAVYREVLGVDEVHAHADFFALGGTSLSATQVASRLSERLGADVAVRTLFDTRTVAALAAAIPVGSDVPVAVPRHLPRPERLPLAYPQRRIWIQHLRAPSSTAYHVPLVVRLSGAVDVDRLAKAMVAVLGRHESLRTVIDDGPWQRLADGADVRIVRVNGDVGAAIRDEITRPFDLECEIGVRAVLFESANHVDVAVTAHHIALDGWSVRLLLGELAQAFTGTELAAPALTYGDYTQWHLALLGRPDDPSSRYAREIRHWQQVLDGAAPFRTPGVGGDVGPGGRITHRFDTGVTTAITAAAQRESATLFQAAHAALASVLGRWARRDDVVIAMPVHGRSAPQWESVVGMFVNTVALRTRIDATTSMRSAVRQARDVALDALAHAEVPYEAVAAAVRPGARDGIDPLTSILLVGQDVVPALDGAGVFNAGVFNAGVLADGVRAEPVPLDGDAVAAKLDAELVITIVDGHLEATAVYSPRVPAEVADALLTDVCAALAAMADDLDRPFPELTALPTGVVAEEVTPRPIAAVGEPNSHDVEAVRAVMADILGVDDVATDEDFFTLGGTSLSATQVSSRLGRDLGVRVPTALVFDHPTPRALASAVAGVVSAVGAGEGAVGGEMSAVAGVEGAVGGEWVPLAPTQRRLWTAASMAEAAPLYAVPVVVPVPDGVTAEKAADALLAVIARHQALRLAYGDTGSGPCQRVVEGWSPDVEILPADSLDADVLTGLLHLPPANSAGQPPVRALVVGVLTDTGERPLAMGILVHHISIDGESAAMIAADLTAAVMGTPLGPSTGDFLGAAAELDARERTERADQLEFWEQALDGYADDLGLVEHRPVVRDLSTATVRRTLTRQLTDKIRSTARVHHASEFHILHAATAFALSVQAGADDIAIATPVSLRGDDRWRSVVGMLVSTVVVRTRIGAVGTVEELINMVRDDDLAATDHALVAFDDVVDHLGVTRVVGRHPLVQIMFSVVDGAMASGSAAAAGTVPGIDEFSPRSEFDLQVIIALDPEGHRIDVIYARQLFSEAQINTIVRRIGTALQIVTGDGTQRLDPTRLLSRRESEFILEHAGATPDSVEPPLLHDILDAAVRRHANVMAVGDGVRHLTFAELDAWVSVTVRSFADRGVRVGDRVGLLIDRSVEWVVAWWAVSRLGAVIVAVDVDHPAARIEKTLALAQARPVTRHDIPPQPHGPVTPVPAQRVSPDALAYIITTSGTTGTPSAVAVTHRGLHRCTRVSGISVLDRVAFTTGPAFDASIMAILSAVGAGAALVVAPSTVRAGNQLTAWLRDVSATVILGTPSVMQTVDPAALPSMRRVFIGGEALPRTLADQWSAHTEVDNVYGPTEATVWVTGAPYRSDEPNRIGYPLPGIGTIILDRRLRPAAPGVVGELYVAGTGLARGYLGDPGKTAARFVAGPGGERLYRTGDLVRWDRRGGGLIYVGRVDRQIKIRGQRVEPAEIDAVLLGSGAAQAATVVRPGPAGAALISYVVGDAAGVEQMRRAVVRTLPRHMVPAQIIAVAALPHTSAGKIDDAALPPPQWTRSGRAPATAHEHAVCAAFESVLGVPVGMDDDFFDAGGNSLALIALRDEIEHRTGLRMSVAELFAHATPAGVVASGDRLLEHRVVELSAESAARKAMVGESAPLWVVHTVTGIVTDYAPLAHALPDRRVLGVQLPELLDTAHAMPESLAAIAARHVTAIRERQPNGPYRLIGWSYGGVLAHEIARQIVESGGEIALLVLLDPRTPAEVAAAELEGVADDDAARLDELLQPLAAADPDLAATVTHRIGIVVDGLRRHQPSSVTAGRVLYLASNDGGMDVDVKRQAWAPYLDGDVEVIETGRAHADLGGPASMRQIAELLEEHW